MRRWASLGVAISKGSHREETTRCATSMGLLNMLVCREEPLPKYSLDIRLAISTSGSGLL